MSKVLTAMLAGICLTVTSQAFATGNNQTPAQLLCTDSAIAERSAQAMGIMDEQSKQAMKEEMAMASSATRAQNRADCIEQMSTATEPMGTM